MKEREEDKIKLPGSPGDQPWSLAVASIISEHGDVTVLPSDSAHSISLSIANKSLDIFFQPAIYRTKIQKADASSE
ncbi:MAG: hypothetical protein M3258_09080 [Thermoproteota archaeon]|nr:hypothetical protein [Thermoproteota archaeon]